MGRFRQLLAGLVLAGFGIVLALGSVEVGVRMLHLFADRFWEPDPLLGSRLIPGFEGWWTQEELEFRTHAQINGQGFRDVEHSLEKSTEVTRILLLGDSFIEALQVPMEAMLGRQLEAQLNAHASGGRRYEVVSMGVSAYGTAGELLEYRTIGRRFHPDVVLVAFYPGNDIKNNSPMLEDRLPPVYVNGGTLEKVTSKSKPEKPGGLMSRLINGSEAYRFFRKRILTSHPDLAASLARFGLLDRRAMIEAPTRDGIPLDYWVFAADWPPEWQEAWRLTGGLLDELQREVTGDGAKFGMLIVTSRERIYPDTWQMIIDANPRMKEIAWDMEAPERKVLQWCKTREVPCLSLSPVFLAHREEGQRLHWVYDGHWTAAGHALAAQSLSTFLTQSNLLAQ